MCQQWVATCATELRQFLFFAEPPTEEIIDMLSIMNQCLRVNTWNVLVRRIPLFGLRYGRVNTYFHVLWTQSWPDLDIRSHHFDHMIELKNSEFYKH